jgi:hypothetical protein
MQRMNWFENLKLQPQKWLIVVFMAVMMGALPPFSGAASYPMRIGS